MKNLSDLLKAHKRFFPPNVLVRETLAELLSERLREPFTRKDIRVQGRTAYVSCLPLLRSEIMMSKKELLNELQERIAPHIIDDIR